MYYKRSDFSYWVYNCALQKTQVNLLQGDSVNFLSTICFIKRFSLEKKEFEIHVFLIILVFISFDGNSVLLIKQGIIK